MGMNFTTAEWSITGPPNIVTAAPGQTATATVSTDPVEVWALGMKKPTHVKAAGRTEITLEIALTSVAADLQYADFSADVVAQVKGGGQVAICSGYLDGATYTYPANDICTASYTVAGVGNIKPGTDSGMTYTEYDVLFGDEVTGAGSNVLSKTITYTPEVADLFILGQTKPERTLMYVTKDTALEYATLGASGFSLDDHQSLTVSSYDLEGSINVSVGNANSITLTSREILFSA